jgi:hypothetical protein
MPAFALCFAGDANFTLNHNARHYPLP